MSVVLTLDPSTVGVRRTSNAQVASVFALDPSVIPVEFGGGAILIAIVGALASPATVVIDADYMIQTTMVIAADPATTIIIGSRFTIISSGSTVFGPNVFHVVTRRDSTVVFRPDTQV